MSTRSRIIIRNGDESLLVIYGHRDVYPSYDGAVLHIHCQSRKMIWELIAPGNNSLPTESVKSAEGEHTFESPLEGVVVAYERARHKDGGVRQAE